MDTKEILKYYYKLIYRCRSYPASIGELWLRSKGIKNKIKDIYGVILTCIAFPLLYSIWLITDDVNNQYFEVIIIVYMNPFFSKHVTFLVQEESFRKSLINYPISKKTRQKLVFITYLFTVDIVAPLTVSLFFNLYK